MGATFPPLEWDGSAGAGAFRGTADSLVDQIADQDAGEQARDGGQWDRRCRDPQTDASDKDDGLEPFAEDGDEGEHEHGIFLTEPLEPGGGGVGRGPDVAGEGAGQLETPFLLELGDAEQGDPHDGDDDGGQQAEDAFPDLIGHAPSIHVEAVKGPDETAAGDDAEQQARAGADPYLRGVNDGSGLSSSLRSDLPDSSISDRWRDLCRDRRCSASETIAGWPR